MMFHALIPSAGKSSRMGRPKLTVSFHGKTVLEQITAAFRRAGVESIWVILGPHLAELPLPDLPIQRLVLPEETAGMRETVEAALTAIESALTMAGTSPVEDAWFLCPCDFPAIGAGVITEMIAGWHSRDTQRSIVIPTHEGKRGHPVLFDWSHADRLRMMEIKEGINRYIRQQPEAVLEMPCAHPGILWNMNTPEDWEKMNGQIGGSNGESIGDQQGPQNR